MEDVRPVARVAGHLQGDELGELLGVGHLVGADHRHQLLQVVALSGDSCMESTEN
jgi:hypothetical protein